MKEKRVFRGDIEGLTEDSTGGDTISKSGSDVYTAYNVSVGYHMVKAPRHRPCNAAKVRVAHTAKNAEPAIDAERELTNTITCVIVPTTWASNNTFHIEVIWRTLCKPLAWRRDMVIQIERIRKIKAMLVGISSSWCDACIAEKMTESAVAKRVPFSEVTSFGAQIRTPDEEM